MARIPSALLDHEELTRLFGALRPVGGALIVGGAVRDSLLGLSPKDVDLATPAPPDLVMRTLDEAGIRTVPTGLEYGVITAVMAGNAYEVTTFRRDVECDGRRAVTSWGASLEEDAQRRDLTINALYADEDGRVIDPTGGLSDLRARRIRFVGNAEDRIREDRLRAFRMYRFWSRFGDPDPASHAEAIAAAGAFAGDFGAVSRERIGQEMLGLLSTGDPRPQIREMARAGVWADAAGAADAGAVIAVIGTERERISPVSVLARFAPLGEAVIRDMMRLPKALSGAVVRVEEAARWADPAEAAWKYGREVAEASVLLRASRGFPVLAPDEAQARVAHGEAASFPVSAADLPHLAGRDLGQALRRAQACWLGNALAGDKGEILRMAADEEPGGPEL